MSLIFLHPVHCIALCGTLCTQLSVWIVFQTVGYRPDGFHTSDVPESKIAGVFDTEATALTRAKAIIGEVYDRPWSEVKDDDDFEMKKRGRATVLEWSPPASEFSLVWCVWSRTG
ncbi:unnamed protein product [Vitrella brassicaformis CCMP3155]|uniref:Uncharacterized protein n=1 Tax=Vitrella brassicaformis (strain CCMP3155) TaxID=1169540 RepID=A0A0G4GAW4_VITBC|nr:unnamed protein product [Vitrella brassicaformis CCMP3155]|eukprot:CEM26264.1 unnamed protein product [Vitrella brassicaformis CCMP3155]